MPIDYTIAAIPTVFGGIQYRSRLEARWAAFFSVINVAFEYEPADLGAWSPDFLFRTRIRPILVEVKPLLRFDAEIASKMIRAAGTADFKGDLLLLGSAPFMCSQMPGRTAIGWFTNFGEHRWVEAVVFMDDAQRSIGGGEPSSFEEPGMRIAFLDNVVRAAWAAASNMVQWRPDGGR